MNWALTAIMLAAGSIVLVGARPVSAQTAADPPPLAPFVLPWDDAGGGPNNISAWLTAPAGRDGPVTAGSDGHFHAGPDGRRVRFLGVNLCFAACFPTHADAEKIAARMAGFGINCVRFHHMDNSPAPNGIFQRGLRKLDADQLDRLDYLVAQLKRRGIYTNLNLHVSRVYPDLPAWDSMPSFHKGVDTFVPRMIELQREYARDLLTHVNPYTKTRYADEPAVAFVEINNENGLIHEWLGGGLDEMPEVYAAELARQWNAWLRARHADTAALRRAWGVRNDPLGGELLTNGRFADGLAGWVVERHGGAEVDAGPADGPDGARAARLNVRKPGQASWHVQFNHPGLALARDAAYTLTFAARADRDRRISVNVGQAHEPWEVVWTSELALTRDWRRFAFTLPIGRSDADMRVNLSGMSVAGAEFCFAEISLRPGGVVGLVEGEELGRIDIFRRRDLGRRTPAARAEWMRFLVQTESNYWQGMQRYIKDELGSRAVVVGTIIGCSTPNLMAALDAVDVHAYWQHPSFPDRPWDPDHWHVNNVSMVNEPGGVLGGLALRRVFGRPLICTEYNHSSPNTYSSEAPLLAAAVAAIQDWDGLFLFSYCHRRDDWNARRISGFFDIDQHPTKMANLPIAAAMFLRGDVAAANKLISPRLTPDDEVRSLTEGGRPWQLVDAGSMGVPGHAALLHRIALRVGAVSAEPEAGSLVPGPRGRAGPRTVSDTGQLAWDLTQPGKGVVTVDSPRTRSVIGFAAGRQFRLGDVTIAPGPTRQDWSTISLTLTEGDSFGGPARVLLVATGYAENTGMAWKDAARTTVGRDWGRAPSLVEVIPAAIILPVEARRVSAWAMDEQGRRGARLTVTPAGDAATIQIGPPHKTLWYEIQIAGPS